MAGEERISESASEERLRGWSSGSTGHPRRPSG